MTDSCHSNYSFITKSKISFLYQTLDSNHCSVNSSAIMIRYSHGTSP